MNIALVVPDTPAGGVEYVTANLAQALDGHGIEAHLVALCGGPAPSRWPYRSLCPPNTRWPKAVAALSAFLRQERIDVVVASKERANLAALIAGRRQGVGVALTRHVPIHRSAAGTDARRGLPSLYRHVLSHADAIVCVSGGLAQELSAALPSKRRHRVHSLRNAVLGPDWTSRAAAASGLERTAGPLLVASGRLVPQKGFEDLLQALGRMRQRAHLTILGDGPLDRKLRECARGLGLADRVRFCGHVADPFPIYAQADVFVLSSLYEGLPTALIEACAISPRVVSTNCRTGPAEILEQGRHGALVPVGDPSSLARALDGAVSGKGPSTNAFDPTPYTFAAAGGAWLSLLRSLAR